jgi:hypothetical protein
MQSADYEMDNETHLPFVIAPPKKIRADAGAWGFPVGPELLMSSPHQQSD